MKPKPHQVPSPPAAARAWPGIVLALLAVLLVCFHRSFQPGQILFSSDGPLGANAAACSALPAGFFGMWQDLNWVGGYSGSAFPSTTFLLLWLLGPLLFAKFYAPLTLGLLGLCAWLFFRQLGFRPVVCLLGGLAAALNTDFFSYACWGLGMHTLSIAGTFLALAALVTPTPRHAWLKALLAGACVGLGVMEGYDSGAILSLYVAAFVVFSWWGQPGPAGQRLGAGILHTALVAGAAAFVAAQALTTLIGTQIQGVAGMEQDTQTRQQRWDEATTWSLPKIESLRTAIPGLFGYRMYAMDGSDYWGRVGETPGMPGTRHSGAGHYAGVLVVLLAFWGFLQSLRPATSAVLLPNERRAVWFWTAAAAVSLLLAWGRHAPFYQLFYALPYASTIRNPVKFLHPFSLSLVILFAYGAEAWWRSRARTTAAAIGSAWERFQAWWRDASLFERRSVRGGAMLLGAAALAWLVYASSRSELMAHLTRVHVPELAPAIARFSILEFGWSVLFLALSLAFLTLGLAGLLGGEKAHWAGWTLGLLLALDLVRANQPWVQYWNFADKYAPQAVSERLREKAHEHRLAILPFELGREHALLQQLYRAEWLQHGFRYYNIQSLDDVQDPRPPADKVAYRTAFLGRNLTGLLRLWELTNTRYLLGLSGLAEGLNQQADPTRKPFREVLPFGLAQDRTGGAIRVVTNVPGPFALIEFTSALPRARLYTHWEILDDPHSLARLADPGFDPAQTLLLAPGADVPAPPGATNTAASLEPVEFLSYTPKHLTLRARTSTPAILLLNDKHDPGWRVTWNGSPQPLLRANYLMRAVALPAGEHTLEFTFRVSPLPFLTSLAGLLFAAALLVVLLKQRHRAAPTRDDRE
ncbi:MAG: hypothetical protein HS113_11795 [Verrucomicrobiales bacterium]|nr:hypothetical protein [Verrucomicrobiales bacterium]